MLRGVNESNRAEYAEKFKARIRLEIGIFEFELDSKLENFKMFGSSSVRIRVRVRIRLEIFEHVRELFELLLENRFERLEIYLFNIYLTYINKIVRLANGSRIIEQYNLGSSSARKKVRTCSSSARIR